MKAQIWQQSTTTNRYHSHVQWSIAPKKHKQIHIPSKSSTPGLRWKAVEPKEVIQAIDKYPESKEKSPDPEIIHSGTTFASDKALWRDHQWHPQISSTVPVGFGPQGFMGVIDLSGIDCTASGICEDPDHWNDYVQQIEDFGEAEVNASLSFGDAERFLGITFSAAFEETSLPVGNRNQSEDNQLLSNYYIGAHLSRNIGTDTAIRAGINNWVDVKECGLSCGFPKSAYAVISQRIRLNQQQDQWFSNAYLTAGMGNGEFRSLDEQVRSSIAAQRKAGCSTYGYLPNEPCSSNTRRRAVLDAANYGQLTPIAAAAVEVYPGFNAIGEWSGRNLNLGFSVRPFDDLGLVFTSMWNNLIRNCDYGCDVDVPNYPGGAPIPENMITMRPVWSFSASLNLKF